MTKPISTILDSGNGEPTIEDVQTIAAIHRRHRNTSPLPIIDQFRNIVEDRAIGKVNGELIDVTSAHAVVTVYDAINSTARAKFVTLSPRKMVMVAWKLVSR